MAIKLENKTNVDGVSGSFPYGKIRDKTSTTAGTPVNTSVYGDFHQFFARILDKSGVVANGLLENLTNGFQYFESLLKLGFKYNSDPIIRGLLGSYTTGDLIILHGVDVDITNSGNTATWTEGAIFYNKKTYLLAAGTVTKTSPQAFVYIISSEGESLMNIIAGNSLSGIADYNGATVKYYNPKVPNNTSLTAFSVSNCTLTLAQVNVIVKGDIVEFSITSLLTVTNGSLNANVILNKMPGVDFYSNANFSLSGIFTLYNVTTSTLLLIRAISQGLNATDIFVDNNERIVLRIESGTVSSGQEISIVSKFTAKRRF